MLNFGASKPRVKGGPGGPAPPDPRLTSKHQPGIWIDLCVVYKCV